MKYEAGSYNAHSREKVYPGMFLVTEKLYDTVAGILKRILSSLQVLHFIG